MHERMSARRAELHTVKAQEICSRIRALVDLLREAEKNLVIATEGMSQPVAERLVYRLVSLRHKLSAWDPERPDETNPDEPMQQGEALLRGLQVEVQRIADWMSCDGPTSS